MTFLELSYIINRLVLKHPNDEVKIRADFPIDGRVKFYNIARVSAEGIVFNNDEVTKPSGHS